MSVGYVVNNLTENFAEVMFYHRPTTSDYEEWFQKGFNPLFPPIASTCNRECRYEVIFQAFKSENAEERVQIKETVKNSIHQLRILVGSESEDDYEKSWLAANKAFEALEKL